MVRAGAGGAGAFPGLTGVVIRPERDSDLEQIRRVNLKAFDGAIEAALVDALRSGGYLHSSLVAEHESRVVGHCALSWGEVGGQAVLVLAPVAVLPSDQGRGVGARLVRKILEDAGETPVTVLGDPAYYGRFGFVDASSFGVESPFPTEPGAFQLLNAETLEPGVLRYPPPFLVE